MQRREELCPPLPVSPSRGRRLSIDTVSWEETVSSRSHPTLPEIPSSPTARLPRDNRRTLPAPCKGEETRSVGRWGWSAAKDVHRGGDSRASNHERTGLMGSMRARGRICLRSLIGFVISPAGIRSENSSSADAGETLGCGRRVVCRVDAPAHDDPIDQPGYCIDLAALRPDAR